MPQKHEVNDALTLLRCILITKQTDMILAQFDPDLAHSAAELTRFDPLWPSLAS